MQSIRSFTARRRASEEGFTLIELMVVVLIIAILIAIAIPQFLGARERAQDRAAQSSLRNALTAAKTAYTDSTNYATATSAAGQLDSIEPSLTYVAAGVASTDFKMVSVAVTNSNQTWSAAVSSKSGTCWWIRDTATGGAGVAGTFYGTGATCTGTAAAAAAGAAW